MFLLLSGYLSIVVSLELPDEGKNLAISQPVFLLGFPLQQKSVKSQLFILKTTYKYIICLNLTNYNLLYII